MDSGPILNKVKVGIGPDDDAGLLYARLLEVGRRQIVEVADSLRTGRQILIQQDLSQGNLWRKRSKVDGRIDWRMSAGTIHNLVRGLTRPYPGAYCEIGRAGALEEVSIWKTRPVADPRINLEPGLVLEVTDGAIVVKAGVDAIELIEHEFGVLPAVGEYL